MTEESTSRRALAWLLVSSTFFFVAYGAANGMAAQRSHVPSAVFAWERAIPFLPWTIVPYWSTDLLYALSFFLCRTRRELDVHGKRLIAAQTICFLVFLVFPLRFSFERPLTSGFAGLLFRALGSFDQPFNQAPSLHVALTTVLWPKYSEQTHGFSRLIVCGWLVLSALSTLTTYQHHFVDLPTGLWVGLFCTLLFSGKTIESQPLSFRRSILASLYCAGAVGLTLVSWWWGGVAWIALWPAGALLIVAVAYATGSPSLLCDQLGKRGWTRVLLLAPYYAAARLNAWLWTRNDPPADEIAPGIWLGRCPTADDCARLNIASVVDLAPELPATTNSLSYRRVPMLDLLAPSPLELESAVNAIQSLRHARPTLVCCALGYSRSASAAVAWLVANQDTPSVATGIDLLRTRRRRIVLTQSHRARLEAWAEGRRALGA